MGQLIRLSGIKYLIKSVNSSDKPKIQSFFFGPQTSDKVCRRHGALPRRLYSDEFERGTVAGAAVHFLVVQHELSGLKAFAFVGNPCFEYLYGILMLAFRASERYVGPSCRVGCESAHVVVKLAGSLKILGAGVGASSVKLL